MKKFSEFVETQAIPNRDTWRKNRLIDNTKRLTLLLPQYPTGMCFPVVSAVHQIKLTVNQTLCGDMLDANTCELIYK